MLLPFLRKFNGLLRIRKVPLSQSAAFGIVMQCASVIWSKRERERDENRVRESSKFYIKPIKGHYDCIMRIEYRAVLWVFLWVNLLSAVSSLSFHAVTLIWIVSHSHFSYTQRNKKNICVFPLFLRSSFFLFVRIVSLHLHRLFSFMQRNRIDQFVLCKFKRHNCM